MPARRRDRENARQSRTQYPERFETTKAEMQDPAKAVIDSAAIRQAAKPASSFFDGFESVRIEIPQSSVFCRIAGNGPPLLLLHGYPQTSAMWHAVAPALAEHFTVICADLRGYGRSAKPPSDERHEVYSKRSSAKDLAAMMAALGHERFALGAHDRGARVAHRLALDFPSQVAGLALLDIAPTREMYRDAGTPFAQTYWHWYWLTQKAPFPETLIAADPEFFWLWKCTRGSGGAAIFKAQALEEYLNCFDNPDAIHAMCEDYRASISIDIEHDDADGGRKLEMPLLALWGAFGAIEAHFDCLALWRERASNVTGQSLPGGHYLAEELPDLVLEHWLPFFRQLGDWR